MYPKWAKKILFHPYISEEVKEKVLFDLYKMLNDNTYMLEITQNNHYRWKWYTTDFLIDAFLWERSHLGEDFWSKLHSKII
jgi:hypothetical protein